MKAAELSTPIAVRTILLATDFSDAAKRAQSYATGLANRFRANRLSAKLLIVHAKEPANCALPAESWRSVEEAEALRMQELKESLPISSPGLESEFCVGEGSAWQFVESALEKKNADFIVLGTRGRNGVGKPLLGSQAEEILRRVSCPVLTVGPHAQGITGAEEELNEVLYATDFSTESRGAAPYAISIALALQAHLSLLHVVEERKGGELVDPTELAASSGRLLRSLIPEDAKFWQEPGCFVETGAVAEKILEVAEHIPASLIVLGVRKPTCIPGAATHLGIGTVHKVIASAKCPVLTVRH